MALIPPERSSKRINKGQLSDKSLSTTRRAEGKAVVRNLQKPGSANPQPSYPVQFIAHRNVRTPPASPTSTDEAFAQAIQNQDESISIATHLPHWQAVQRYWINYFEAQESLMVSPELVTAIMKDINRPWSNKQEH